MASLVLCLLTELAAGQAAVAVFPATKGYAHFQFSDYAKLTIIGVIIACIGWPVVARVTSDPRWVFFRLAILVTIVLLLPDLYIWTQGQPGQAVLFLALMHLSIAVITYNLLVRVAPVREPDGHGRTDPDHSEYSGPAPLSPLARGVRDPSSQPAAGVRAAAASERAGRASTPAARPVRPLSTVLSRRQDRR